jgi:hypothetical protein
LHEANRVSLPLSQGKFETDQAGRIIYPVEGRPDGKLMESQRQIVARAERLEAKLRELGIDPDSI